MPSKASVSAAATSIIRQQYTAGTIGAVRRIWRIYRAFLTSSLQRELEFRVNFLAKVLQNLAWIVVFTLIVVVVYNHTDTVAGWSRGESFVLAATIFLIGSVASAFFFSLIELPEQVRRGTLDFVVTKPIDSQFFVSVRRFNFDQIGASVAGLVLLGYGLYQSGHPVSLGSVIAYALSLLAGIAIYYGFMLALMTLGIWLVRVDNLWVLGETVQQVARYPLDIYSSGVQRLLTFVLPLGFLAFVPAQQIVKSTDWPLVLLGVVYSASALCLSRLFWQFAMKHYSSASS
jgi:ABC-2 type transport system permease protein